MRLYEFIFTNVVVNCNTELLFKSEYELFEGAYLIHAVLILCLELRLQIFPLNH